MDRTALAFLIREMPKAELHVHLDGALRVSTALRLAQDRGISAPRDFESMTRALVATSPPTTESELLTRFELPVRLMQDEDALRLVTSELIEAKAADRVRYLEIKWAPWLHTAGGLSLEAGIEAVCSAAQAAEAAAGTVVRLVVVAVRSHTLAANLELVEAAARFRERGVTGFDFAGSEADHPDPLVQQDAFDAAQSAGLGITLHAGDLPGSGPLMWRALELNPARIAHGVSAADDPRLCAELAVRGVALDLCPTSNVHSGAVADLASHPLAALHRLGVPVTLSTDDPTISAVTLSDEFRNAVDVIGLELPELWAVNLRALAVAFADASVIAELRAEFQAWAGSVPELRESTLGPS